MRIYVPGGPRNGAGASAPFTIEVTPVPAAALIPEASSNISLPSEGKLNGAGGEEAATEGLETEAGPTEAQAPTPAETKQPKAGKTEEGATKEGKTKKGKAKEGKTGEETKGGKDKEAQGAQEPEETVGHRRKAR